MDDLQTRVYYQSLGLVRHDANLRLEGNFQALFKIFNDALSSLQERHLCYRLSLFLNNPKGIRELHRALKDAVKYFSRYHEVLGTLSISGEHRTKRRESVNRTLITVFDKVESDIYSQLREGLGRAAVSYVDLAARVKVYIALMQVDFNGVKEKGVR